MNELVQIDEPTNGTGETSKNDKLRVAWEGMGNTRAGRANTAKRAPNMLTHHHYVRVLVCISFIQWEISHQHVPVQWNNKLKQERDGAAEHLKKHNIQYCF